ncbi:MAG: MBL fold metallo-hydrolase [Thermoplasmatota archaeon]
MARAEYANLDPFERRSFADVRRWRRERKANGWVPKGEPPRRASPDAQRIRAPPHPQVTWIGHATTLIQLDGQTFLTDPVFGNAGWGTVKREVAAGLAPRELPRVDALLVSHNHPDHLDPASVKALPRSTPVFCPAGLGSWFRRRRFRNVTEMPWWQSRTVGGVNGASGATGGGIDVTAVPAQHWSRRGMFDEGRSHWCGYVVSGDRTVYFAGDTAYFSGFRQIAQRFQIDLAILPIGAYEPRWFMRSVHMQPEEAAQAYGDLGAKALMPMHWGTFRLTDEPLDEPPRRLADAMAHAGKGSAIRGACIGETVEFP